MRTGSDDLESDTGDDFELKRKQDNYKKYKQYFIKV